MLGTERARARRRRRRRPRRDASPPGIQEHSGLLFIPGAVKALVCRIGRSNGGEPVPHAPREDQASHRQGIASARRRCAASPRRQPLDLYLLRKQVFNGFLARRTGSLTVGRVSGQSKTWPASRDLLGCSALQPCRLPAPNKRAISFGHVSRQACVKDAAPSFCTRF